MRTRPAASPPAASPPAASPPSRGDGTRARILVTAERLFALHGVAAVSNRQISEAAGQANNSVIAYHFGSRPDLMRAIVRPHNTDIEQRRIALLAATGEPATLTGWTACLVRPITDHFAALDRPSWYARFAAQANTDPALRNVITEEALATPSTQLTLREITLRVPALPPVVQRQRTDMTRLLVVHMCAELERALEDNTADTTWSQTADALITALTGLWTA
ncbi:TetR/AcrR family transcriptional regulator [Actinoplanes sp. GCM10030250]|uniref:TetR/AcrR family transcriptional regulator n=1 Tax=Actinoplanes sp. GCM10030250 TaxID=3273376 RepID=UPI00361DA964